MISMRSFKIIVITLLLVLLAGLALMGIKKLIPDGFGPSEDEIAEIYHDDDHEIGEDDVYSQTLKQYEGTIKPLGVSIYQEGTHRLESEGSLVVLLESTKVNLPDFVEKEVKVRGYVRDTVEGAQKIMDVRFVEQLKESGVKAFNEVGYEWSFSYPADWKTSKEKDKVTFSQEIGEDEEKIMIVYQYDNVDQDLESWLSDRDQNLFFETTQVKVGDRNGVRRSITNGDQKIIKTYTKAGDVGYEIRLLSQDEVITNQYYSIVDFFQTGFQEEAKDKDLEEEEEEVEVEDEETNDSEEEVIEEEAVEEEKEPEKTEEVEEEEEEEAAVEESESETLSEDSLTTLEALSSDEIQRVVDKGLSPFSGRTLSFGYPKVWYFAYLDGGGYGFTDGDSYADAEDEISIDNSRVLLLSGKSELSCVSTAKQSVEDTEYTVCAREPGLEKLIELIADSITKPAAE